MRAWMPWVAAGVVLLPQTSVHAQQAPFEDGDGKRAVGVEGVWLDTRGSRHAAAAVPRATITSTAPRPTKDELTIRIEFSENVTDFILGDIELTNGNTISPLTGSGRIYSVDVLPKADFEGDLVVTIPAGVAHNAGDPNPRASVDFPIDTRDPTLREAVVDGTQLYLTYNEDLKPTSEPGTSAFTVKVNNASEGVDRVNVRGNEVTLTLDDPVSRGDDVELSYVPPNNDPIQDEVGNPAASLTDHHVTNETQTVHNRPSAPRNLTATAVGRTSIDLEWRRPARDGGSSITGYRIQESDDGGTNWDDLERDTNNTDTVYTHARLDPGTTRHYRVAAFNTDGLGDYSDIAHATTEGGLPAHPLA